MGTNLDCLAFICLCELSNHICVFCVCVCAHPFISKYRVTFFFSPLAHSSQRTYSWQANVRTLRWSWPTLAWPSRCRGISRPGLVGIPETELNWTLNSGEVSNIDYLVTMIYVYEIRDGTRMHCGSLLYEGSTYLHWLNISWWWGA